MNNRINKILDHMDNIIYDATIERHKHVIPYRKDVNRALNIVQKFIIANNRIIYGGLSQNEFIKIKNKKETFYKENSLDIPDFDIYSPTPILDLVKLANELHDDGFIDVNFSEAVHMDTYTLFLDRDTGPILDISYVWNPHYNIIKKVKIGNYYYAHPEFMFIDLYKIYTDPLLSFDYRIEKVFKRVSILEKYYKISFDSKKIQYHTKINDETKNLINQIIINIISNKKNIIINGIVCYNYYIANVDKLKITKINYLSIISDNIINSSDLIYNYLIKINKKKEDIKIEHYHKFFQVFDKSIHIKYKNKVLVEIVGNNDRCIPYITISKNNSIAGLKFDSNITLNLITYHGLLLQFYSYLFLFKYRKQTQYIELYKYYIHTLQHCREIYLLKNKFIGIEKNNIFRELVTYCKYNTYSDKYLAEKKIKKNIKNKKPPIFNYRPSKKKITLSEIPQFKYSNTSGNLIK